MTASDNEGSDLLSQTSLAFPWAVRVAATLRLADLIASDVTHLEELAAQAGVEDLSGEQQARSLARNRRAPTRSQRFIGVNTQMMCATAIVRI